MGLPRTNARSLAAQRCCLCALMLLRIGFSDAGAYARTVYARDGPSFVEALVGGADELIVDYPYLTVLDEDWAAAGYGDRPFVLDHNVTFRSSSLLAHPPVLRLRNKHKIKLESHVTLSIIGLVGVELTWGNGWLQSTARGADLMAPSDPLTVGARVLVQDSMILDAVCPPSRLVWGYVQSIVPTSGSYDAMVIDTEQPGCVNATFYANGSVVPPAQRCWAYRVTNAGLEVEALDTESGTPEGVDANFVLAFRTVTLLCEVAFTDECVARLGPQSCVLAMTAPVPWFDRYVRDVNAALAAKPAAAELDRPPASPRAAADAADAPSGQSSKAAGADHTTTTVAIAVGVAAGVAVACALGLGLFVWVRRRRAASSRNSSDAESMFTKITLGLPQASPAATNKLTTTVESGEGNECAASMALRTGSSTSAEVRIVRPSSLTSGSGTHAAGYSDESGSTPRDQSLPIEPAKPGVSRASAVLESANGLITEDTPYRSGFEVAFHLQVSGAEPEAGHKGPQHAPTDGYLSAPIPIVQLTPQVLGKGGFGRVFAGEMGDQPVAVKLIAEDLDKLPSSEAALVAKSFEQELEVLARCTHPCIVRVLAACAKPPRPCIVMERMETSLERMLYGKTDALLPLPVVIHIALEVARALEYLHPTVMHRDLKPGNVLINNPDSPKPVVKITDFGLSRLRDTILQTMCPEAGTPAYLAPECFDLEAVGITYRADIYAWGVLVWEALAGMQPWLGLAPVNIALYVHVYHSRLPMPPAGGPGGCPHRWPPKLMRLLAECWDKDPLRRPAAAELVKRLLVIQQDLHRAAAELHKRLLPSSLDPPALGASGGAAAQPPAGARAEAANAATMEGSASGLTDNLGSKSGCAGRKASAAESGAALGSGRSGLLAQQAAAAAQLQAFARGLLAMTQHPVITSRAARQVESIPEAEEEHELREAD